MQFKNDRGAQLAAAALVGLGRVGKAVAEDDLPGLQSGLDHLGDGLGAVGEHQRHLGHRRQTRGARVQHQRADAVAGRRAARLAGHQGGMAALLQPCGQAVDLRGFAGTIQAFERDKETARHGLSLPPKQS